MAGTKSRLAVRTTSAAMKGSTPRKIVVTIEDERKKLALVVETAREVRG